jgi:uncharacterized protein (TIGR02118 family)
MIRVTGFFRWEAGAVFNHDYFRDEHMRLARDLLAPLGLVRLESDKLFAEEAPALGQLVAATSAYFSSLTEAQVAVSSVCSALRADLHNFTTLNPELHCGAVATHVALRGRSTSLWAAALQARARPQLRAGTSGGALAQGVRGSSDFRRRSLPN